MMSEVPLYSLSLSLAISLSLSLSLYLSLSLSLDQELRELSKAASLGSVDVIA